MVGTKDFGLRKRLMDVKVQKITVNILDNPSAPIVSSYEFCQNSTASSLSAVGTDLKWYTSSTGGVEIQCPIAKLQLLEIFLFGLHKR